MVLPSLSALTSSGKYLLLNYFKIFIAIFQPANFQIMNWFVSNFSINNLLRVDLNHTCLATSEVWFQVSLIMVEHLGMIQAVGDEVVVIVVKPFFCSLLFLLLMS